MVTKEEIEKEIRCLTEDLVKLNCDVIYEFPFKAYLAYLIDLKSHLGIARHPYISQRRRNWFRSIVSSYDSAILCRYNKLSLAFLMRDSLDLLPHKNLPDEVVDLYYQWFTRVMSDFGEQSDGYYSLESEAFGVDLGVCCLRSIPVGGAWVIQQSRIGLGPFIRGGPWQLLLYLSFIIRKTSGFSPFYVIHTASRYLPRFRPEEMNLSYMRIAGLMKRDPSIRGLYRGSWFLDPNLEKVSPNLAFLRTEPQWNGARLFRSVTVKADIKWALSMSSVRRRLYEEGKYRPTSYAYIWPRKALLEWTERQKEK